MLKQIPLIIASAMFYISADAQAPADSAAKISPVKTLSYEQYLAYTKGEDINNVGEVARLNHFPMPDKALKLKKELDLSPVQIKKLVELATQMNRRKLQTGGSIVSNEKMLDSLFHTKQIDEGSLIFYTQRYGQYLGEFRNAVLFACISTQKLLTPQQIRKYEALQKGN